MAQTCIGCPVLEQTTDEDGGARIEAAVLRIKQLLLEMAAAPNPTTSVLERFREIEDYVDVLRDDYGERIEATKEE